MNDMNNMIERLSQGSGAIQPSDANNWNQTIGSAPPDQFGNAATQVLAQLDPNEYAQHVQPGAGGTDPLGSLPRQQQTGIAQSVISALLGGGLSHSAIAQGAGLPSLNPGNMSTTDLSSLLQWTQQNHPQALGNVATQYQNQPGILASLLGNRALMSTVTSMGMQFLGNEMGRGSGQ